MRTEKEIQMSGTRKVWDSTTCDICGFKAKDENNWAKEAWEREETTILLEEGFYYPDGNYGEKLSVDICPNCFKTKLVPWLEAQGAKMRKKEWSY